MNIEQERGQKQKIMRGIDRVQQGRMQSAMYDIIISWHSWLLKNNWNSVLKSCIQMILFLSNIYHILRQNIGAERQGNRNISLCEAVCYIAPDAPFLIFTGIISAIST